MNNKKPYKDGVTLEQILLDGWSRGFLAEQTVEECAEMGYIVDYGYVNEYWKTLSEEYSTYDACCIMNSSRIWK